MPYEYRSLTSQERDETVNQRRQCGYPLHGPPHPYREAGSYLITAANYQHHPVIALPERRSDFEYKLLSILESVKAEIIGWVVLPNHYHALVQVESFEMVSLALKSLHGSTSRAWNQVDGLVGKRQVWYRYSDRMIRDENHFFRTLNYIHYNPVKHGYVGDVYAWVWSSIWMYLDNCGRDWLRENWIKYPPGEMGGDWDA